jgi:hypothetical protein
MKAFSKTVILSFVAFAMIAIAFLAGRWSGSIQQSLRSEAEYPWKLHRKIGSADLRCENLLNNLSSGRFYIQSLDDGSALVVASLDRGTSIVTAFALDVSGHFATDTWSLDCK